MVTAMNEERFWQLLGSSDDWDDPETRYDDLEDALQELSQRAILGFYVRYDRLIEAAWREELSLAAFVVNCQSSGRLNRDDFLGFLCWLIDQGKAVYLAALVDPDSLADRPQDLPWYSEGLWLVAQTAWEIETGKSSQQFHETLGEGVSSGQELPSASVVVREDVQRRFPRLTARSWDDGET